MYKILLVDDEELERKVLHFTLENSGLPIIILGEAANGREALDKVQQLHPDLIIMDIKMPGIDGIEATRQIKTVYPGIEVIMLTAYGKFSYSQQAIKAQASDYLLKPIQPQQLIQAVRNALDRLSHKQFRTGTAIDMTLLEAEIKALNLSEAKKQLAHIIEIFAEQKVQGNVLNSLGLRLMVIVVQAALSVGANPASITELEAEWAQELSHLSSLDGIKRWGEVLLEQCLKLLGVNHVNNDSALVRKAMEYIESHYAHELSLQRVAEHVHLSPAYLSRMFNKKTGVSFSEFMTQVRLKEAKQCLRSTDETIDQIALATGFSSSSYFTAVFRKHEGMTPSEYRLKYSFN